MDDMFTEQSDSLSQLAKELKNVSFSLDDIQKSLNKKDAKFATTINAPSVEKTADERDKSQAKNDAAEAFPVLVAIEKNEPQVKAEENVPVQPLLQEEYLNNSQQPQANKPESTPGTQIPKEQPSIQQNFFTVKEEASQQISTPKSAEEKQNKNDAQPEKLQAPVREVQVIEKAPESKISNAQQNTVVPEKEPTNVPNQETNTTVIKNEIIEKIQQPETKVIEKIVERPVLAPETNKINKEPANIIVERPAEAAAPAEKKAQQQTNRIVNEEPAQDIKKTQPEMPAKLNVQEERPAAAQPGKLEIINERDLKLAATNPKDVSLLNIEKIMSMLANTLNKNHQQVLNQLTALNNVANEIVQLLPMLAQKTGASSSPQYSREYKTVGQGKINEFRNLTSDMFAPNRADTRPTLS